MCVFIARELCACATRNGDAARSDEINTRAANVIQEFLSKGKRPLQLARHTVVDDETGIFSLKDLLVADFCGAHT